MIYYIFLSNGWVGELGPSSCISVLDHKVLLNFSLKWFFEGVSPILSFGFATRNLCDNVVVSINVDFPSAKNTPEKQRRLCTM